MNIKGRVVGVSQEMQTGSAGTLLVDVSGRLITVDDLQDVLVGGGQTGDLTAVTLQISHSLFLRHARLLLQTLNDGAVRGPDEGPMVRVYTQEVMSRVVNARSDRNY